MYLTDVTEHISEDHHDSSNVKLKIIINKLSEKIRKKLKLLRLTFGL